MIASVYIKDGNIYIYNENRQFTNLGGLAYELGRPLLDFVCYEPDRFDESFSMAASAFDNEFAYMGAKDPAFISAVKETLSESQQHKIYVYLYQQMFTEFIYAFIDSPKKAITQLEEKIPGTAEKLRWTMDFEWPVSKSQYIQVQYADKEKRLYRAALDVVSLMSDHLYKFQKFIIHEIEVLLHYRGKIEVPVGRSIDYIDILDEYHTATFGVNYYLEKPFITFYGRAVTGEIEQLYGIEDIEDLFRFEFAKMAEHDIFIKNCKNCERFFIPRGRSDVEYCNRIYGDGNKKCSEIGAMLRYEKKVAENPVLEAHKKAYRRCHSRVRSKKMTQAEFMRWSDEAAKKRDACLAGELSFEEFVAWLEQGRVRKSRGKSKYPNDGLSNGLD